MVEKPSLRPGGTAFERIRALHESMNDSLVAGMEPSPDAVSTFFQAALESLHRIRSIEERNELRYLMRLWGSYLAVRGVPVPELNIDVPALPLSSPASDAPPSSWQAPDPVAVPTRPTGAGVRGGKSDLEDFLLESQRWAALLDGKLDDYRREELLAHLSAAHEDYVVFADTASILRELEEAFAGV